MKTMILTAKSYADLKPFEIMAKKEPVCDIKKFDNMCKEARKFAKKAGLTQNDISDAIKEVRK
jgi:hypothetical protein